MAGTGSGERPRRPSWHVGVLVLLALSVGCASSDAVTQVSTFGALLDGLYDGDMTFAELVTHGDFGLGTLNALDGEMVAVDGRFFQVTSDGSVHPVPPETKTPFAVVTFFKPEETVRVRETLDYEGLLERLDRLPRGRNTFLTVRVQGTFAYLKARSVPRQSRPYPGLLEVVKDQPTFEFHDEPGVLVGFRFPGFMQRLNVAGYHFHFINDARTAGGHVLDCQLKDGSIAVGSAETFHMVLPRTKEFLGADFTPPSQADVERVEQEKPAGRPGPAGLELDQ